jgi:surfactin synthase thioesterase subunit
MERTSPVIEDSWVRRYHPGPAAGGRLVCFPHAGGSASFFFPVSAALSSFVEVSAIQYPGRQDRRSEPNIDNIPDLADAIFHAVRPLAGRPLAFFGHSMGAVLAYEVAWRLEEAGADPLARLYVSGRRAPSRYRPDAVHERGDEGVIAELRQLSGTNPAILGDPEMLDMILPALRADYRAIETYRDTTARTVRAPVVAVIGEDDPRVTPDEARAWAEHTTGPFDLRTFPGGHFYLADRAQEVIRMLADDLRNP